MNIYRLEQSKAQKRIAWAYLLLMIANSIVVAVRAHRSISRIDAETTARSAADRVHYETHIHTGGQPRVPPQPRPVL